MIYEILMVWYGVTVVHEIHGIYPKAYEWILMDIFEDQWILFMDVHCDLESMWYLDMLCLKIGYTPEPEL